MFSKESLSSTTLMCMFKKMTSLKTRSLRWGCVSILCVCAESEDDGTNAQRKRADSGYAIEEDILISPFNSVIVTLYLPTVERT